MQKKQKSKIGIILFSNLRYSPYLNFYTEALSQMNDSEYKVIYLNRYKDLNEPDDDLYTPVNWWGKKANASSKFVKTINFIRFKNKVIKLLNKEKFDFLIVLSTIPSVLLSDYLCKHYKGRYVVDVRDFTYENVKWFFNKEKQVFDSAALRVISSPGFKTFLPENQYLLCHNFSLSDESVSLAGKDKNNPIVISYIGSIGYASQCKKLIDLVAKDSRFCFFFYGNDVSGNVTEYVKELQNDRISMKGAFKPCDKPDIYQSSDLIFNCYGNGRLLVKCAVSNKYYDGAYYRKPLIVSPNTILEELSGEFAYPLDLVNADNLDELYCWYNNMDFEKYDKFAQNIVNNSLAENLHTKEEVIKSIKMVLTNGEKRL